MTHVCKTPGCGETDISKFRVRGSGNPRSECRKCENKARNIRKKNKKLDLDDCKSEFKNTSVATTEISKDSLTGILTATITTQGSPADPDEYLASKGINTEKYIVSGGKLKNYMSPMKLKQADGSEVPATIDMFSITANLIPKVMEGINFGLTTVDWKIPEPKYKVDKTSSHESVLVIPDAHFGWRKVNGKLRPTHDPEVNEVILELINDIRPDRVVMLGDTMDFPEYGRHPTLYDVKGHTEESLKAAREFLFRIRQLTDAEFDLLEGNHDKRPLSFIADEVKKISEIPGAQIILPSLSRMLGLEELNITYHSDPTEEGWDAYSSGDSFFQHKDVLYIHGHACGKDAPRKNVARYMMSVCTGHIHKAVCEPIPTPTFVNGRRRIKTYWAICPGYIGTTDTTIPAHSPETEYPQGLTLINHLDVSEEGNWSDVDTIANPIHIVNKKCYYGGKVYSAA